MKTLRFFYLITGLFLFSHANSQNPVSFPNSSNDQVNKTQIKIDAKPDTTTVVVNMEMIRRFRECKPDTSFMTLWDILEKHDFTSIREAYVAYYNSYFQKPVTNDQNLAQKQ